MKIYVEVELRAHVVLPLYPLDRRLGWPPRVGLDTVEKGKNVLPLPGVEPRLSSL
jgi:hypothetical protein